MNTYSVKKHIIRKTQKVDYRANLYAIQANKGKVITQKEVDAEIADYILNHSGSVLNFSVTHLDKNGVTA